MFLLNSSGLVVQIPENTPTMTPGAWGNPSWTKGSVGNPIVTPALRGAVINNLTGVGAFALNGQVSGIQGSVYTSFVTGTAGTARTIWYLTDNLASPANRIVLGIDTSNRPLLSIRDRGGVQVALVAPSYTAIGASVRVSVALSWNSVAAVNGSRFATFVVNGVAVADADWTTNPTSAWGSFSPTYCVLGAGVGGSSDANGQILSVQIANTV
jgi:hypothetical protein